MSAKFKDMVSYFENLAKKHKDIGHTNQEKHFFRMEIDEVLAGITRKDVKHPYLILEGYSFDFRDSKSDNLQKNRRGAFVLLDHVSDPSDFDAIHDAWDRMEEIGTELLVKIKNDKHNPLAQVVKGFEFSSAEGTLIGNEIDGNYGIRFSYSLTSPRSNEVDPDKWLT